MTQTIGDLVADCLRAVGARRVFAALGAPNFSFTQLEIIVVANDELARHLCDADGFMHQSIGVSLFSDGRLRLSSSPGEEVATIEIVPNEIPVAVATWSLGRQTSAIEIDCGDFNTPLAEPQQALQVQKNDRLVRLGAEFSQLRLAIVAGAKISGHIDEVWAAAQRSGAIIYATVDAVGALASSHPLWGGVIGLQSHDEQQLDDVDVVIAVGCDGDDGIFTDHTVVELEPAHLAFFALDWPEKKPSTITDEQREQFSAAVQQWRSDSNIPLHPVRALSDLFEVVGENGIALSDPVQKIWCARMLSTPHRMAMPRFFSPYFSIAAAIVAAMDGEKFIGITTMNDEFSEQLLQFAAQRNLSIVIERWGVNEQLCESKEHRAQLVQALNDEGVHVLSCAVRNGDDELVSIFGPFLAAPMF